MVENRHEQSLPLTGLIGAATWLNKRLTAWMVLLLLAIAVIIGSDIVWHWSATLAPRSLRGMGKLMGSLAAQGALLAVGYYVAREIMVLFNLRPGHLPEGLAILLRQAVVLLRLLHPAAGAAALTFGVLHFYLLQFAAGRVMPYLLYSGLGTLTLLFAILASGLRMRRRSSTAGRFIHRLIVAAFFLALLLHKIHS